MASRARDWLAQAERDLALARQAAGGGFHEWACFAAQQSAEKAVKGLFQHLGGEAWGHSVKRLLEALPESCPVPAEVRDAGRVLDRYYIPTRYPNGFDEGIPAEYFEAADSDEAIRCAERVVRFCQGHVAGS